MLPSPQGAGMQAEVPHEAVVGGGNWPITASPRPLTSAGLGRGWTLFRFWSSVPKKFCQDK